MKTHGFHHMVTSEGQNQGIDLGLHNYNLIPSIWLLVNYTYSFLFFLSRTDMDQTEQKH
jgi:hypothetical protein